MAEKTTRLVVAVVVVLVCVCVCVRACVCVCVCFSYMFIYIAKAIQVYFWKCMYTYVNANLHLYSALWPLADKHMLVTPCKQDGEREWNEDDGYEGKRMRRGGWIYQVSFLSLFLSCSQTFMDIKFYFQVTQTHTQTHTRTHARTHAHIHTHT